MFTSHDLCLFTLYCYINMEEETAAGINKSMSCRMSNFICHKLLSVVSCIFDSVLSIESINLFRTSFEMDEIW